jgi:Aerotolerance regulator N-terminal
MFESLFLNPAALTLGGALISAPILIHLINRMRFKRLRWAAMEFLLKSQKRNRRRLIIEQLLLLLLRCLLILLAGLLLSRFIGCTGVWGGGFEQKPNLHLVILDDTLSMSDKVKDKDDCFKTAKREVSRVQTTASPSSAPPTRSASQPTGPKNTADSMIPTLPRASKKICPRWLAPS